MWKKAGWIWLCAIVLIAPATAAAEQTDAESALPKLSAYLLMEAGTGQTVLQNAAEEPLPVAGLTKLPAILTLCQAFDDGSIAETAEVSVGARAAKASGPSAFLEEGESIHANELIKAAVMISAGDAVLALTEHAFGSESVMLENMQVTLEQAGAGIRLSSVLGSEQPVSADNLAKLAAKAVSSETFLRYAGLYLDGIEHSDGRRTELVNANRLIRSFPGCAGLLTGSSPEAGYSGVFYAVRGDTRLIAVIIGAGSNKDRFMAAETLFTHGFQNYTAKTLVKAGAVVAPSISVRAGTKKSVNLVATDTVTVLLKKNAEKLTEVREIPEYLEPPILTTSPVGRVTYLDAEGNTAAEIPLFSDADVEPFGMLDILKRIVSDFVA